MISLLERQVTETPLAIVDLETTGLVSGGDKIVEVAVVRAEPGAAPQLVLNTLVDPHRPVAATEIHGITDADIAGAPDMVEIAGNIADGLENAVLASYNVYFETKFLEIEYSRTSGVPLPPYVCLMYMRPMLNLGKKCSLGDACRAFGVDQGISHQAATDALASAKIWQAYAAILSSKGVRTFADLAKLKAYKFLESFGNPFTVRERTRSLPRSARLKSRNPDSSREAPSPKKDARDSRLSEYWDGLKSALTDFDLDDWELRGLEQKRNALQLTGDEVRFLHGRAFAAALGEFGKDHSITLDEAKLIARVADALRQLGWAPGDAAFHSISDEGTASESSIR
jgi:DNA polymerase III epsilon subunit-like protein